MTLKILFVLALFISRDASACGDLFTPSIQGIQVDSERQALEKIRQEMGLVVTKADFQSRCGGVLYKVLDPDGKAMLGYIDVRAARAAEFPQTLYAVAREFNQTPKERHLAWLKSTKLFYEEADAIEKKYGLRLYKPNALADSHRFPGKSELVYASIPRCYRNGGSNSGHNVGTLRVRPSEFVIGRRSPSEGSSYRPGDLEKALLGERYVLRKVVAITNGNAENCRSTHPYNPDWKVIKQNLQAAVGEDRFAKLSKPIKQTDNPDMEHLLSYKYSKRARLGKPLHCLQLLNLVSLCNVNDSNLKCNPLTGKAFDSKKAEEAEVTTRSWKPSNSTHKDQFILKNPGDGFVYLFTDTGVFRVNLNDQDYFRPGVKPAPETRRHGFYRAQANGKEYWIRFDRYYFEKYNSRDESYSLESTLDAARLDELCKDSRRDYHCVTPTVSKVDPAEAEKLIATIALNQLEHTAPTREMGNEWDGAPDCSVWEKVKKTCDLKQLDGRAQELIAWNLAKSYRDGIAQGNLLCKKGKDRLKALEKEAGAAAGSATEAR